MQIIDDEGTPALSVRDQWWSDNLGTTDPIGEAAFDTDPDADGLNNLLEYALGSDPTDPADRTAPVLDSNGGHLTLTFRRARAELTYEVLASSTLASDSWQIIATNPGQVGEEITVEDPALVSGNPRRFLRLRITP